MNVLFFLVSGGFLEWGVNLCAGPYTGNVGNGWDMILTSSCTARAAQMVFDFGKMKISTLFLGNNYSAFTLTWIIVNDFQVEFFSFDH